MTVQPCSCADMPRPFPACLGLAPCAPETITAFPLLQMAHRLPARTGPGMPANLHAISMRAEQPFRFRRRLGEWRSSLRDVICRLGRMPPVCSHERTQPLLNSPIEAFAGDPVARPYRGS